MTTLRSTLLAVAWLVASSAATLAQTPPVRPAEYRLAEAASAESLAGALLAEAHWRAFTVLATPEGDGTEPLRLAVFVERAAAGADALAHALNEGTLSIASLESGDAPSLIVTGSSIPASRRDLPGVGPALIVCADVCAETTLAALEATLAERNRLAVRIGGLTRPEDRRHVRLVDGCATWDNPTDPVEFGMSERKVIPFPEGLGPDDEACLLVARTADQLLESPSCTSVALDTGVQVSADLSRLGSCPPPATPIALRIVERDAAGGELAEGTPSLALDRELGTLRFGNQSLDTQRLSLTAPELVRLRSEPESFLQEFRHPAYAVEGVSLDETQGEPVVQLTLRRRFVELGSYGLRTESGGDFVTTCTPFLDVPVESRLGSGWSDIRGPIRLGVGSGLNDRFWAGPRPGGLLVRAGSEGGPILTLEGAGCVLPEKAAEPLDLALYLNAPHVVEVSPADRVFVAVAASLSQRHDPVGSLPQDRDDFWEGALGLVDAANTQGQERIGYGRAALIITGGDTIRAVERTRLLTGNEASVALRQLSEWSGARNFDLWFDLNTAIEAALDLPTGTGASRPADIVVFGPRIDRRSVCDQFSDALRAEADGLRDASVRLVALELFDGAQPPPADSEAWTDVEFRQADKLRQCLPGDAWQGVALGILIDRSALASSTTREAVFQAARDRMLAFFADDGSLRDDAN